MRRVDELAARRIYAQLCWDSARARAGEYSSHVERSFQRRPGNQCFRPARAERDGERWRRAQRMALGI